MGILCLLILLGAAALVRASGDGIRHGDEKAEEYFGGMNNGENQGG